MEDTLLIDDYLDDDEQQDNTHSLSSLAQKEVVAVLEQLDANGRNVKHPYSLYIGVNTIGRDAALNTVVIQSDSSSISKQHAVISINTPSASTHIAALSRPLITQQSHTLLDAEEVFITDVGSANKTLILPHYSKTPFTDKTSYRLQPHKPRLLKHGEFVYLGSVCCKFSWKDYEKGMQRAHNEKQRAAQMDETEDVGATQVYDDQDTEAAVVAAAAAIPNQQHKQPQPHTGGDAGDTLAYDMDEEEEPRSNTIHHTGKHKYLRADSADDTNATLIYNDEDAEKTQVMEQQKEATAAAADDAAPTMVLLDEEDGEEEEPETAATAPSKTTSEKAASSAPPVPAEPVPAPAIDSTAVQNVSPAVLSFSDLDDMGFGSPSLELAVAANSHETADTKPATATATLDVDNATTANADQSMAGRTPATDHSATNDKESKANESLHPMTTGASRPTLTKATASSRKPPAQPTQPRHTRSSVTTTRPPEQEGEKHDENRDMQKEKTQSDQEQKQVAEEKNNSSDQRIVPTPVAPSSSSPVIQQAVDHPVSPSTCVPSSSADSVPWRTKQRKLVAQEETKPAQKKGSGSRVRQSQPRRTAKKTANTTEEEKEEIGTETRPQATGQTETAMNEEPESTTVMQTEVPPQAVAERKLSDKGKDDVLESVPGAQSTSKRGKPTGLDRRKRKQLAIEIDESPEGEVQTTPPEAAAAAAQPVQPSSSLTSVKRVRRHSEEIENKASTALSPSTVAQDGSSTAQNAEPTDEEQQATAVSPNTRVTRKHSSQSDKVTSAKARGQSNTRSSSSASSSKASVSVSSHTHPSILFTGIDGSTYADRIRNLDGSLCADVESATHLISDKIRRTERFLAGYSITPYLMNLKWLDDSLAQGTWLAESAKYQLQDRESEKQFGFEIKNRQVNADCLQGWSIYCTPQVIPTTGVMEQIVKAAGGTLLRGAPTEFDDHFLIISCPPDVQADVCAPMLALRYTIYDKEMVLTTVLRQRVELKEHILVQAQETAVKASQPPAKKGKGRGRR